MDALQTVPVDWCARETAHDCPPDVEDKFYGFLTGGAVAWIGLQDVDEEVFLNTTGWRWEKKEPPTTKDLKALLDGVHVKTKVLNFKASDFKDD